MEKERGSPGAQQACQVPWTGQRGAVVREYLLYLPQAYGQDDRRWPFMLFMHGAGERGSDVQRVAMHGPPRVALRQPDFPFILASPQCPSGAYWDAADLMRLAEHIQEHYSVDPDRVYATGLSMGGFATWDLATRYTGHFAAAAPVCGGGDPRSVCSAKDLPIWAFHGDADEIVPVEYTLRTVEALRGCGGNVRMTIYPGVGHDSWTQTYDDPEVYAWLLSHTRNSGPRTT